MDEILASIRRIIESGDDRGLGQPQSGSRSAAAGGAGNSRSATAASRVESPISQQDASVGADAGQPHAEHEQDRAVARQPVAQPQSEASTVQVENLGTELRATGTGPVGYADISAIRGSMPLSSSSASISSVSRSTPAAQGRRGGASLAQKEQPAPQPDFELDDRFAEELMTEAYRLGAAEPAPAAASETEEARADFVEEETAGTPDRAANDERLTWPADSSRAASIEEDGSLVSENTGREVAAAFDELSRAIREGEMRSLEEMTREMLRPMLQEWLDDNLPRLVERLVREEIERVARGSGRR
ncbi:PopZ family protein [Consotaella aegiceratis]|uniref:PopZ family protein n=1 Tax=Consotaella aegiceratis TaxID=3097961 RepID=UPI002F3ED7E6